MGRVLHVRIFGVKDGEAEQLRSRFDQVATSRVWRDELPWLADSSSTDLFAMEFLRHAEIAAEQESPDYGPLSAATFLRVKGDETDALALLFMLRDLSETFGLSITVRDPDNPIAKLRSIDMTDGRLTDGRALEELMVRRPVFKKLPDGFRIEMFPPRALGFAFGTVEGEDGERRSWSFLIHGMRGSAPTFFEAEAEAMRMYHGLRRFD